MGASKDCGYGEDRALCGDEKDVGIVQCDSMILMGFFSIRYTVVGSPP